VSLRYVLEFFFHWDYCSVPNVFFHRRDAKAQRTAFSLYCVFSASLRLCGEKDTPVQNMLGTEGIIDKQEVRQ